MNIVFLVEERSMAECLNGLLPRLIPEGFQWQVIPHEGKTDLEQSIPRKLRGWNKPDVSFVVLRDKDAGDCHAVKARLVRLCQAGRRPDTLVRIVCHALESWFLGDFAALERAFNINAKRYVNKSKYQDPDRIADPAGELATLIPGYGKVSGARALGQTLLIDGNKSPSYCVFVSGVRRLIDQLQGQKYDGQN